MVVKLVIVFVITGITGVYAQADSLQHNVRQDSAEQIAAPVGPGHAAPTLRNDVPFTAENTIRLQPDQIPPSLRKTLEDSQYANWEKGILVQHMQTGEFRLELVDGTKKETYFFDSNGERVSAE